MKNGVDHGFCINYFKLSHRRKFIRTVWLGIVSIGAFSLWHYVRGNAGWWPVVISFFAVGFVIQAAYEYRQWQGVRASAERAENT